jgi:hypothetical protein
MIPDQVGRPAGSASGSVCVEGPGSGERPETFDRRSSPGLTYGPGLWAQAMRASRKIGGQQSGRPVACGPMVHEHQGGPPGRTRHRLGAHAAAPAGAPAATAPDAGRPARRSKIHGAALRTTVLIVQAADTFGRSGQLSGAGVLPNLGIVRPGQNPSRPSVAAGQLR